MKLWRNINSRFQRITNNLNLKYSLYNVIIKIITLFIFISLVNYCCVWSYTINFYLSCNKKYKISASISKLKYVNSIIYLPNPWCCQVHYVRERSRVLRGETTSCRQIPADFRLFKKHVLYRRLVMFFTR